MDFSDLLTSPEIVALLRLSLAGILGAIIGAERELSGHPAGLRTNILIAVSSCLFTLLSIRAFPIGESSAQDTARVAAQIVTGVGFLGAGAVIQTKRAVYGLTTAATIWMVAAVGMAAATDLYLLAIVTTIVTTLVLWFLVPISIWMAAKAELRQEYHNELHARFLAKFRDEPGGGATDSEDQ